MESARENFLCKHCNIVYQGTGAESFVSIEALRRGRVEKSIGKVKCFLGIDLAMTTITALSQSYQMMVTAAYLRRRGLSPKAGLRKKQNRAF